MTKKDYELLAKPFHFYLTYEYSVRKNLNRRNDYLGETVDRRENEAKIEQLLSVIGFLGATLQRENSKFDLSKFEEACGVKN